MCRKKKPESEFAIKRGTVRNTECKACKREYNKGWYKKNKDKHIQAVGRNNKRYFMEKYDWVNELKKNPCTDCRSRFHPCAMDFDHLDPKAKTACISVLLRNRASRKLILAEIAKCELVCANCHRLRTFNRRRASGPMDGIPPSKRF